MAETVTGTVDGAVDAVAHTVVDAIEVVPTIAPATQAVADVVGGTRHRRG